MAEITMNDLKDTYIKLLKDVPVYKNWIGGDSNTNVWWTKRKGELAGKVWMWAAPGMAADMPNLKNAYLIFKLNDNFDSSTPLYFIKFDAGMIDWEYSKQQLAAKKYADMSLWEQFTAKMEKSVTDYTNEIKDYVTSGFKTGGAIVAGVLLFKFIVMPWIQYKIYKGAARDLIKEAKRRD